ncbi:hypothetical protein EV175_007703, partial [Coemansia sp. RSA 1933]
MSSSHSDTLTYVLGALLAAGIAYFLLASARDKASTNKTAGEKLTDAAAVLHATDYRKFKLVKKTQVSSNTARYRFELPAPHA